MGPLAFDESEPASFLLIFSGLAASVWKAGAQNQTSCFRSDHSEGPRKERLLVVPREPQNNLFFFF